VALSKTIPCPCPTGNQNLHAETAEGGISGRRIDGGLSGGPHLVKPGKRLLGALADFGLLLRLRLRLREGGSCDQQAQGKHHRDQHSALFHGTFSIEFTYLGMNQFAP